MQKRHLESVARETKRKDMSATAMAIDIGVNDRDSRKVEYHQLQLCINGETRMYAPKNNIFINTPSEGEELTGHLKVQRGVSSA